MMKKFFVRRFKIYSVIMIAPLILVLLVSGVIFLKTENDELLAYQMNTFARIDDNLENTVRRVIKGQDEMMSNAQYALSIRKIMNNLEMDLKDVIMVNALKVNLAQYEDTYPYIFSVYLYLDDSKRVMVSDYEEIITVEKFFDQNCLALYREMDETQQFLVIQRQLRRHSFEKLNDVVTIYQRMNYMTGVIVVNLRTSELLKMYQSLYSIPQQCYIALNQQDEIVLAENETIKTWFLSLIAQEGNQPADGWRFVDGQSYYLYVRDSAYLPIRHALLIPGSYVGQDLWRQLQVVILFLLLILILTMFIAWMTTKSSFKYIRQCVDVFALAERGESVEQAMPVVKDEYGLILNNIILMYLRSSKMQLEIKEKQLQIEMSERMALQLQINPHFISNTLQTIDIEVLREIGHLSVSHTLLQELNSIVSYIFRNLMEPVTLEEEMNYLRSYCEIQYVRFPDQSIVYYEVDDDILQIKVFRLILQPVIENCFNHGRRGADMMLYIHIRIKRVKAGIRFYITDNGKGMSAHRLKEITSRINNPQSHNVGLTNLNRRLLLNYGEASRLHITSKEGRGTNVSFIIRYDALANLQSETVPGNSRSQPDSG